MKYSDHLSSIGNALGLLISGLAMYGLIGIAIGSEIKLNCQSVIYETDGRKRLVTEGIFDCSNLGFQFPELAITISIVAILISLISFMKSYEYYKLSLRPLLSLDTYEHKADKVFKIHLDNKGVGPAILEELYLEKIEYKIDLTDLEEIQKYVNQEMSSSGNIFSGQVEFTTNLKALEKGTAISAGETITTISIQLENVTVKEFDDFNKKIFDGFKLNCKYKSIYEKTFHTYTDIKTIKISADSNIKFT